MGTGRAKAAHRMEIGWAQVGHRLGTGWRQATHRLIRAGHKLSTELATNSLTSTWQQTETLKDAFQFLEEVGSFRKRVVEK